MSDQNLQNKLYTPEEIEKLNKGKYYASYGGDPATQLQNSHIVYSKIQIAGEEVLSTEHFTLTIREQVNSHSEFEITCGTDAFDERGAYPFENSKTLLGKRTSIQFFQFGKPTYIFTGLITEITNKKIDGNSTLVIIGKSPTILLDGGKDSQSFENVNLQEIITRVSANYQQDLVHYKLKPRLKDKLLYTVKNNQSDWEFIQSLAARFGEWHYYNGQQIVLGGSGGKTVELVEEEDVYNFELKMKLVPQNFSYVSYDSKRAEKHTVHSKDIPLTRRLVNPFQKHALKASEEVYPQSTTILHNPSLLDRGKQEATRAVEAQKLSRQNVFYLEAKTNNPNLRLGDIVKLNAWMPGHTIFKNGKVPLESYVITNIEHFHDLTEGYYNVLTGVPMDNTVPPYIDENAFSFCENQSAIVTDHADPEKLSRVRVRFSWMKDTEQSPWLRVQSPYAGAGRGMHFIPEKGEEVVISFEGGHPEKPYVSGSMYNGKAQSGYFQDDNSQKAIQLPSGVKLVFHEEGSLLAEVPCGSSIFLNKEGDIITTAKRDYIVNAERDIVMSAGRNMETTVDKNKRTIVGGNNFLSITRDYILSVIGMFREDINGDLESHVNKGRELISEGKTEMFTGGNVNKNSQSSIKNNSGEKTHLF